MTSQRRGELGNPWLKQKPTRSFGPRHWGMDLRKVYNFIKKRSIQGARNVVSDIRNAPKDIRHPKQTQVEEYYPTCRRIIVRNYKVLHQVDEDNHILNVVRVFDTRQDPDRLRSGDF